jgi:hypothetical protein
MILKSTSVLLKTACFRKTISTERRQRAQGNDHGGEVSNDVSLEKEGEPRGALAQSSKLQLQLSYSLKLQSRPFLVMSNILATLVLVL